MDPGPGATAFRRVGAATVPTAVGTLQHHGQAQVAVNEAVAPVGVQPGRLNCRAHVPGVCSPRALGDDDHMAEAVGVTTKVEATSILTTSHQRQHQAFAIIRKARERRKCV